MNIVNLNKLIAHLEAQPPERINMAFYTVAERHECGTAGCIAGHIKLIDYKISGLSYEVVESYLGIDMHDAFKISHPNNYSSDASGVRIYPAHRVIATLKRLRDTYLATGQVVVDWGPEPGEEPKTPWVAPQVAEVIAPALPAEITSLLRLSLAKTEA